ncbi:signal peptidase I [Reinekea sp.]|jgi:signal peptidase I|uniref:signal peptidase I n=1 Tax=Reinekea sp. TaxID=1970455 RepID=UPI0039898129
MSLYALSAAILLFALAQTGLVFWSYRKRLNSIDSGQSLSVEQIETVFKSTPIERSLGYALIAVLGYLILQTIKQGFDFAVLMLGATVFAGVVWGIDRFLTKKSRDALLARAEESINDFDDKVDRTALEPGLIENSKAFFPILVFVFVLRSFLIEPFQIPSGSMRPTLEIRDFILVNRFAYGIRMPITNKILIPVDQPQRGEVIVFKPPHEPEKNFIKRVIAVPGDTVQYDYATKQLRVNGEIIEKTLVDKVNIEGERFNLYTEHLFEREHAIYTNQAPASRRRDEWLPSQGVVVPEGKYFVMGDNRDNSHDARYWEGTRRLYQGDASNKGNNAWGFVDEDAVLGKAFAVWMHWKGFYPSFSRTGSIQ